MHPRRKKDFGDIPKTDDGEHVTQESPILVVTLTFWYYGDMWKNNNLLIQYSADALVKPVSPKHKVEATPGGSSHRGRAHRSMNTCFNTKLHSWKRSSFEPRCQWIMEINPWGLKVSRSSCFSTVLQKEVKKVKKINWIPFFFALLERDAPIMGRTSRVIYERTRLESLKQSRRPRWTPSSPHGRLGMSITSQKGLVVHAGWLLAGYFVKGPNDRGSIHPPHPTANPANAACRALARCRLLP